MNIEIDKLTPCLEHIETGKIVKTTFSLISSEELETLKNWQFDWLADDLSECYIFKLLAEGDNRIQGLVALQNFKRDKAVYVKIAESAPHNLGKNKAYNGVGGHLFAIAARRSNTLGYNGFIFMDAKNVDLVKHYSKTLGAELLGIAHQYRMIVDEEAAQKLLQIYTVEEG